MRIKAKAISDVGNKRTNNEDSYAVREDISLYVVADGMGGHSSGELASQMAVQKIAEFLSNSALTEDSTWPYPYDESLSFQANRLKTAISMANEVIYSYSAIHPESHGMGTTVVAALKSDEKILIGNVGDSRAYHLKKGKLKLLTSDHSWVNEQVRLGHISSDEAARHPFRNVITRALGTKEEAQPDIFEVKLHPGEMLLLCSDGLNSMADDEDIERAMAEPGELEVVCRRLVELANRNGGEDNITVLILKCEA